MGKRTEKHYRVAAWLTDQQTTVDPCRLGHDVPVMFDEPILDEPVLDEPVLDEPILDEPVLEYGR